MFRAAPQRAQQLKRVCSVQAQHMHAAAAGQPPGQSRAAGGAHRGRVPRDNDPRGVGAVDAREVVQEPGELLRAQRVLFRHTMHE